MKIFKINKVGKKIILKFIQSITPHNNFVLKGLFSKDNRFLYSVDQSVFKATGITIDFVLNKDNKKVIKVKGHKEEIFELKCD